MSEQRLSRRSLLTLVAGLPLLAACSSTPPRVFTLTAVPGTTRTSAPKTLALHSAGVPRYLDRPQIVRYSSAYELQTSDQERWGEPFGNMIDRVLAEDMSLRLPGTVVFPANGAVTETAQVSIQLDIARFDIQPDGSIVLAGQWAVRSTDPKVAPFVRTSLIEEQATSASTPDAVLAMSRALGRLADEIVAALPFAA